MKTFIAHLKFQFVLLFRTPAFWVPTILFPVMLYGFFGASLPPEGVYSQYAIASFCAYGVIGVSFYQFGVGIAQDRESAFDSWMRTLPGSSLPHSLAQVSMAILFSLASVVLVLLASIVLAKTTLSADMVIRLLGACIIIAIPAALMGITLGYITSGRAAPAIANLVFLPLAFLGGLWIPPINMSAQIRAISDWTPTRQMAEFAWASVSGQMPDNHTLIMFAVYCAVFGLLSFVLIARDRRSRFE